MDQVHVADTLLNAATAIAVFVFLIFAYKTFTYVDRRHADYWRERRGPFLPAIDLLYNSYLLLGFLLRRDYKTLEDSALDKLADNTRLLLIFSMLLCILKIIHF
jgi:hypothetical protein